MNECHYVELYQLYKTISFDILITKTKFDILKTKTKLPRFVKLFTTSRPILNQIRWIPCSLSCLKPTLYVHDFALIYLMMASVYGSQDVFVDL